MITPFNLHHLWLLLKLQKQSVSLSPVEALTRPQSPMWAAMTSLLNLDGAQLATFVLDELRADDKRLQGFIQVEQPQMRPEAHVWHISPRLQGGLDTGDNGRTIWNRLLNHVVAQAGEQGRQRVFACAPEESEDLHALQSAGFSVYTRETILRLAPDAHPQAVAQEGIRPEESSDAWPINQLYRETAPHLVQQAESPTGSEHLEAMGHLFGWGRGEGFVLEDKAGIVGYGHLTPGQTGHWLTCLVHERARRQADKLLDYGLALLHYYPPLPVYCAVREYQGLLRIPLEDRGFEPVSLQCRMVKHTTAWVKEPAPALMHALEKRAEAHTSTAAHTERS